MYKVRKHLANGPNKGKWQIRKGRSVWYADPYEKTLVMFNCKLVNKKKVAKRIYEGEQNKSVCAWIECKSVIIANDLYDDGWKEIDNNNYYEYNPRQNPFWIDEFGDDKDGTVFDVLITDYTQIVDGTGLSASNINPQFKSLHND